MYKCLEKRNLYVELYKRAREGGGEGEETEEVL